MTAAVRTSTVRQPAAPVRVAMAALVDVRACSAPRLRAIAEECGGRPVGVIGTFQEAKRAASMGVVVGAFMAPPLGSMALASGAMAAAFGRLPIDGSLRVHGPRAEDAARLARVRTAKATDALPAPVAPLARDAVRAEWGIDDAVRVCLLVAGPAGSCDARRALDVAGRTAMIGGPVVLVVHPGAPGAKRAVALSTAEGGAWQLVLDERAEEPELLAAAADAAMVIDMRVPLEAPRRALRGVAGLLGAFARGEQPMIPPGDAIGARLAVRAGLPLVVAEATAAAAVPGLVPAECMFDPRRPNVAARALQAILSAAPR